MRRTALAAAFFLAFVAAKQRAVRPPLPPVVTSGPTFSKEVVRVFQAHCQTCHHPGDIAPFSLMEYGPARDNALQIKLKTRNHEMPPWKPLSGCGDFAGTRVLSQDEIDLIARWVDNGAPQGNPADLPTPLDFSGGWALGEPDLVLSYSQAYTPPASGDMYRCFPLPTNVTSDRWVSAIDIKPGDPETVHHVIAYIDTTGESQTLDEADPGPGYTSFGGPGFSVSNPAAATLGGWAPGARPIVLPDGIAYSLPANARIVLQVHYHPHHANPKPDITKIGIYYAKAKPSKRLYVVPVINTGFAIPPNDSSYHVGASVVTPLAAHLWVIAPHMHLLGRKMKVQVLLPSGESKCLIDIDDWDFNWQGLYRYADGVPLPPGAWISLDATYDNSTGNVRNPNDPPRAVYWGEQTTDEMCIAFLGVTLDIENMK